MVELAGHESVFTWGGTFGALLVPGALTGGLLGWAEYRRRTGRRRGQAWLILAPLPFVVAPMLLPGALRQLVTSGLGGGAIAVAAMGVVGGFALSGRGRRWARVLCGTVGVAFAVALAGTVAGMSGQSLTEPRAAWAAVLAAALFAVLALGCSIPFRDGGSAAHTQKAEVTP
jgi:MFS family permease